MGYLRLNSNSDDDSSSASGSGSSAPQSPQSPQPVLNFPMLSASALATRPYCHESVLGSEVLLQKLLPNGYPRNLRGDPNALAVWVSVEVAVEAVKHNAQSGLSSVKVSVDAGIVNSVVERLRKRMPKLREIVLLFGEKDGKKTLNLFW
jgi:hypothetical protein